MAIEVEPISYFHLSGAMLEPGSLILPGNWGRVIRSAGWRHDYSLRELALEDARVSRYPDRPSRLDAAFIFLTLGSVDI